MGLTECTSHLPPICSTDVHEVRVTVLRRLGGGAAPAELRHDGRDVFSLLDPGASVEGPRVFSRIRIHPAAVYFRPGRCPLEILIEISQG